MMAKETKGDKRADRLKSALRQNLKKRKTVSRKLNGNENSEEYKLRERMPGKPTEDQN